MVHVTSIIVLFLLTTNVFSKSLVVNDININYKEKNYNSIKWRSLLHFDGNNSIIKDKNFFVSKKNNSLEDEFVETIKSFMSRDIMDDRHSICKYPARFNYIIKELNLDRNIFPKPNCKDLNNHIKNLSPKKIYISYASEQITSPSSMMGHMFLKIVGKNENSRIVENALSYYAINDEDSSFKLLFESLFFNLSGYYILTPFRERLNNYNDSDQRNIWDYELNLTEEQVLNFIYHIWELKNIEVPYNFVSHNCGTATIMLLSVINDEFYEISKKKWSTPLDFIKKIYSRNLINSIDLNPSDSYRIKMFQDNFSKDESKIIKNFIYNRDISALRNSINKNNMLVMADYFSNELFLNSKIELENYNAIKKIISDNFDGWDYVNLYQKSKFPIDTQYSSSLKFSYEKKRKDDIISLMFYPVYHELYDSNFQYFNDFELNLLKAKLNYNLSNKKFYLNYLDLISIKSFNPSTILLPTKSFKFNLSYRQYYNSNRGNIDFNTGIGKTYSIIDDNLNLYFILSGRYFQKLYLEQEFGFNIKMFEKISTFVNFALPIMNDVHYKNYLKVVQSLYINDKISLNFEYEYYNLRYLENYDNFSIGFKYFF